MSRTWKVLWVSQHKPLTSQIVALSKKVPEEDKITLVPMDRPVSSVEEIVKEFLGGNYDDMIVIKPLSMVQVLTFWNISPWVPKMERVHRRDDAEVINGSGVMSRFVKFIRVKAVRLEEDEEHEGIGNARHDNKKTMKGDSSNETFIGVLRALPVGA